MNKLRGVLRSGWIAVLIVAAGCLNRAAGQIAATPATNDEPHPQVNLELRFGNGRTQFHIGELIPVELVFRRSTHEKVGFGEDCRVYSRYEYRVIPNNFLDRAPERGAAGLVDLGQGCHGFHSEEDLAQKPLVVRQNLNDWFRMTKSGLYKVSVTTWRTGFAITSNTADLEILPPDPLWEKQELTRIVALMDSGETEKRAEGCGLLAYLETADAEREMGKRYLGKDYCDQDLYQAVINARNRKLLLNELEAGIMQAERPIFPRYLEALALVSLYQKHPEWYTAQALVDARPYSILEKGPWKQRGGGPSPLYLEELRYAKMLISSISLKTGSARALSLKTLLDLDRKMFLGAGPPNGLTNVVRRQMPRAFLNLPYEDQEEVLQNDWTLLDTPAMIPILKQIVNGEQEWVPRGLALRRLSELSPNAARPFVLKILHNPKSKYYGYRDLSGLPEKELPALDHILLERVKAGLASETSLETAAGLIYRYASAAVASDLRAMIQGKLSTMSPQPKAYLIAYFLRVDPITGRKMLFDEIASPDSFGLQTFRELAEISSSPAIEQAAIHMLDSQDTQTVVDALSVLRHYGSIRSKRLLRDYFRKWTIQYRKERKAQGIEEGINNQKLERGYLEALAGAQAWLTSAEEIETFGRLCITGECKDEARQMAETMKETRWTIELHSPLSADSQFGDDAEIKFAIGLCNDIAGINRLKQKILQYSKGSIFTVSSSDEGHAETKRVYDALYWWAAKRGFHLRLDKSEISVIDIAPGL